MNTGENPRAAAGPQPVQAVRRLDFLLFTIPPAVVLVVMNLLYDRLVADIGGDRALADRYQLVSSEVAPALAHGRFEWMTHLLGSALIYAALALLAVRIMTRQVRGATLFVVMALFMLLAGGWAYSSMITRPFHPATEFLFTVTREVALARYDRAFALDALLAAELLYAMALMLTILMIFAGASVLCRPYPLRPDTPQELAEKRSDLKVIVIASSLLLTLLANTVGTWLRWPAEFVLGADEIGSPFGTAEEIRSTANGLQVFFGTGYTLTLAAFSIPAVVALSRRVKAVTPPPPEDSPLFGQHVFSRSEFAALLSIAAPAITTLIGGSLPSF